MFSMVPLSEYRDGLLAHQVRSFVVPGIRSTSSLSTAFFLDAASTKRRIGLSITIPSFGIACIFGLEMEAGFEPANSRFAVCPLKPLGHPIENWNPRQDSNLRQTD